MRNQRTEAHVVILLFLFLLLLLWLLLLGSRGSSSGLGWASGRRSGSGRSSTSAKAADQVVDLDALERVGEKTRPVRLDVIAGSLEDGAQLIALFPHHQCKLNSKTVSTTV